MSRRGQCVNGPLRLIGVAIQLSCLLWPVQSPAQSASVPPNVLSLPAPSPQSTPLVPLAGASPQGTSVSTVTPFPGLAATPSSSLRKSFGSAGKGLPGMPGGPAVNGSVGAQDPSGKYMRPPVILPLLCDPAIELPC